MRLVRRTKSILRSAVGAGPCPRRSHQRRRPTTICRPRPWHHEAGNLSCHGEYRGTRTLCARKCKPDRPYNFGTLNRCSAELSSLDIVGDSGRRQNRPSVTGANQLGLQGHGVGLDGDARFDVTRQASLADQQRIASTRVRTPEGFFEHPQLNSRDRWRTVETAGGPVKALLPAVDISGRDAVMGAVPSLGAHNASLRAEFSSGAHVPEVAR